MSDSARRARIFQRLFPFLLWRHRIDRASLRADAAAALVIVVLSLPQGVAFAVLAGMPPQFGLYSSILPCIVAALWGSSLHNVTGPTNANSLLLAATLSPLAAPGSEQYIGFALTLTLMTGLLLLALGVTRLGSLANFISQPVVMGLTLGVALLIIASQLGGFFGIRLSLSTSFFATTIEVLHGIDRINPWAVLVGVTTLGSYALSRRVAPRLPAMLPAMLAGAILAWLLNARLGAPRTGLLMIDPLPQGLPALSLPDFSPDAMQRLLGISFSVALLTLTQAISAGRAIAAASGQRFDPNQELIGQGLANITASFTSGFSCAASFNRSGANYAAGARTPLAGVLSAVAILLIVLLVAPLVAYLPVAVVSALLFLVAWNLLDLRLVRRLLRTSRSEGAVLAFTLTTTLLLDLEIAILVGVIVSMILFLNRTAHPILRALVPDSRTAARNMVEAGDPLPECPQLKILRVEGSLYFGAVSHLEQYLDAHRETQPAQKHLLVMSKSINFIDTAGAESLMTELRRRRESGGDMYFYSLRKPVEELLERAGYLTEIGRDHVFRGKHEAFAGVFARLDRSVCAGCRARIFRECATIPGPMSAAEEDSAAR